MLFIVNTKRQEEQEREIFQKIKEGVMKEKSKDE